MPSINRDPRGKWIDGASAMSAWFPLLPRRSLRHDLYKTPLILLARYFVNQAGEEFAHAARTYRETDPAWISQEIRAQDSADRAYAEAQKCFHKRDIIMQALKDLEAVDAR